MLSQKSLCVVISNPRFLKAANDYTPKQEIKALVCQYKQLPDWKRKIAQSVINNLLAAEV